MKKFIAISCFILGLVVGAWAFGPLVSAYRQRQETLSHKKYQVVEQLKQSADLVSTEVIVQKLAIYDSSQSEKFSLVNPGSWHLGERMCAIPVSVTLKYGFDLNNLSVANFHTSPDGQAVEVILPPPQLIDSGYATLLDKKAYCYASTLAQAAGHHLKEQIRREAYQEVLKDDILKIVSREVEHNGQKVFRSLLQSLGYSEASVVVRHEK